MTPVFGTTSVLHATLRAATSTTNSVDARDFGAGAAYPLFAPSSHPVPPIRARSSSTEEAPPGKIHLADGQTVRPGAEHMSGVLVTDLQTGVDGLERVLQSGGIGHGLGFSLRKGKGLATDRTMIGGSTWRLVCFFVAR